jgi:hypothetical protein
MDELVQTVATKAGIPVESAQKAVRAVLDFVKAKVPGGEQVESFLNSNAGSVKDAAGNLAGKVGGMLGGK